MLASKRVKFAKGIDSGVQRKNVEERTLEVEAERKRDAKQAAKVTRRQSRAAAQASRKGKTQQSSAAAEAMGIVGLDNLKDLEPKLKRLGSQDGRIKRSKHQIIQLQQEYEERNGKCPPKKKREQMAKELDMTEHQIYKWFWERNNKNLNVDSQIIEVIKKDPKECD